MANQGFDEIAAFRRIQDHMGYGSHGQRDDEATYGYRSQAAYDLIISNQNNKAVQVVAAQASDLEDCLELLAMLGLDAQTTRPAVLRTEAVPRAGC